MWVILCASIWFRIGTEEGARAEYSSFPVAVQKAQCNPPQYASPVDMEYYHSHEYKPDRVESISPYSNDKEIEFANDQLNEKK